ncbi:MAG: hypothetical protein VX804_06145 [Candidatus Thermoplasmatota archaeon]|nr:hypothetical protein [Candidatus Thermoplasmatota archaeon]
MESRADITQKSVRLTRQVAKSLDQAIQLDRALKIGWGRDGDERPKKGETGVLTHLPAKLKMRLLGELGDLVGSANQGALLQIEGKTGDLAAAFQSDGKTIFEKGTGDRVALGMSGGTVIVRDDVGVDAGESMTGGLLVIRGMVGERIGSGMIDGTIVALSNVDIEAGSGMIGGKIVVDGRVRSVGKGAQSRSIEAEELVELNDILEPHGFKLTLEATVIEADSDEHVGAEPPEISSSGKFDGLRLCPQGSSLSPSSVVNLSSEITMPGVSSGTILRNIWIPQIQKGPSKAGSALEGQPCIVDSSPRENDYLRIHEGNYLTLRGQLSESGGAVIDISSFPNLNESAIHAMSTIAIGFLPEDSPVLLMDGVDRVEKLLRMTGELGLAGAIVDVSTIGSAPAISALPTVGMARSKQKSQMSVFLKTDWTPSPSEALMSIAAGLNGIVSEPFIGDESQPTGVKKIATELDVKLSSMEDHARGWMQAMGVTSINLLQRQHLRATNHEAAVLSGLRLDGIRQPLPMWSRR